MGWTTGQSGLNSQRGHKFFYFPFRQEQTPIYGEPRKVGQENSDRGVNLTT
jgi:ribosomal protein L15